MNSIFQERHESERQIPRTRVNINGVLGFDLVLDDQGFVNIISHEVMDYLRLPLHLV